MNFFGGYGDFLEAMIPLSAIGALLFWVGAVVYQRFYVQYIFSDFLAVVDEGRE